MEPLSPKDSSSEADEFFTVDKILDVDIKNNVIKYKVRWEGYTSDDDTWEPEENLNTGAPGVEQLFRKFKMKKCERIQKLKETLANRVTNRRQSWYYDSHVSYDNCEETTPKETIIENGKFFDEEVSQITGETKKLLDMSHKYTETEIFLSEIASRDRITRTQMKELRGSNAANSLLTSDVQSAETTTRAALRIPRTPGRANKGEMEKQAASRTPGRTKMETASRTPGRTKMETASRTPGRAKMETAPRTPGRTKKGTTSRTPGRTKKQSVMDVENDLNNEDTNCVVGEDIVDSDMEENHNTFTDIRSDIIMKKKQYTLKRKRESRSYWEYASETDENEAALERELDDNDLFFGEKVSELKGEKKKLVDKNHKMSSTEMILSKMDVGQRITRNQMKILSTSSDSPLTFSSPTISPVSITKPRKRRSLIKKDSFTIAEPEEKILTPKRPILPIAHANASKATDINAYLELDRFPIITSWEEYRKNKERQRMSIRSAAEPSPQVRLFLNKSAEFINTLTNIKEFLRACKDMDAKKLNDVYAAVQENQFANYCKLRFPDDSKNILHFIAAQANCKERNHIADEMVCTICRSTIKDQLLRQTDNYGKIPLHYAAINGLTCLALLFIENGSPINVDDRNGDTPLHIAYKLNQTNLITLLLQYGASCHQIHSDIQNNLLTHSYPESSEALNNHMNNIGRLLKEAREKSLESITEIMVLSPIFIKPISEGPEFYFKFQNTHFSLSENKHIVLLAVYLCKLDEERGEVPWKVNCYPRLKMQTLPLVNRRVVHDAGPDTPMIYPCTLDPGINDILIRLSPESIIAHKYILACHLFLGVLV